MRTGDNQPEFPSPGEALFRELQMIHAMLRRDLEAVQTLSARVLDGAPASAIDAEVAALQTNSVLWKFRVNCLYYCRFVHGHHTLEDQALFPAVLRSNPELGDVIDKLEADHRLVATYLDEINDSTRDLLRDDTIETRDQVAAALDGLAEHLLAHLAFEEESLGPAMRAWESFPP